MRVSLGQPVIIENVTGANGSIGTGRAAHAAPDGYTVTMGQWNTHVGNGAVYALQYDVRKDFEPIGLFSDAPMWLVGKTGLPAKDLKELVAWLKANPDAATAGTVGIGSVAHVAGIFFQQQTSTKFRFIPYRGGAPALQDLMAGAVDLVFTEASYSLTYVQGGKINAYAVMSKTRWARAPEVPTVEEIGAKGFYISFWQGLWAPKGTPKQIIVKLNAAVGETLADPVIRQRLTDLGQEIPPREQQTSEALGAFQKAEIEKWWPIIRAANIKAE
jgi:tripartite-type tricarboxylate transporter receptor subunit TctC